jgi:hypothetical protein
MQDLQSQEQKLTLIPLPNLTEVSYYFIFATLPKPDILDEERFSQATIHD